MVKGSNYEIQYKLHEKGHNHIITISTHRDHFKKCYGQFSVDITITYLARMENIDFTFITNSRFATRGLCEARPKDFDYIKRWMLVQEEIRDYAIYHDYCTDAVVSCIQSFLMHLDNEVEKSLSRVAGMTG